MDKKLSFRQYYNTYFEKIYRYIFFRVDRNKELAEDLTSEIMLKAFEKFADFDHAKNFGVWIYRIAHNHLVDFYKKGKLDKVPLEDAEKKAKFEENYEKKIDQDLDLAKVKKVMEELPEKQKDIVIMKFFDDLSHKEIADILNMNEAYVRVSLHRAISFIKERVSYLA